MVQLFGDVLVLFLRIIPRTRRIGGTSPFAILIRQQRSSFFSTLGWEDDAERLATERHNELHDAHYGNLIQLAKLATAARRPRIEVVCYRQLLRTILDEKRSKAYGHAARYFQRLTELDGQVKDYRPLRDHSAFVDQLRADHGRKYGFWNRAVPPD